MAAAIARITLCPPQRAIAAARTICALSTHGHASSRPRSEGLRRANHLRPHPTGYNPVAPASLVPCPVKLSVAGLRAVAQEAAVEDVRQPSVDDLALETEAGLLHHSARGDVVRQRERDDLASGARSFNRDLDRGVREFGGETLPPALGDDRPADLDLVLATHVACAEDRRDRRISPLPALAEQPEAEAVTLPVVDLRPKAVDKSLSVGRHPAAAERLRDPRIAAAIPTAPARCSSAGVRRPAGTLHPIQAGGAHAQPSRDRFGGGLRLGRRASPSARVPARRARGTGSRSCRSRAAARCGETAPGLVAQQTGGYRVETWVSASIVTSAALREGGGLARGRVAGFGGALTSPRRRTSPRGPAGLRRERRPESGVAGDVSPEITILRPGRGAPITCSG